MTNEEQLIEQLRQIDTPTLANAIELLNVRPRTSGFANRHLRQIFPELGVMCGYAVTAQAVSMCDDPPQPEDIDRYSQTCAQLDGSPKPGIVVMQEIGPHREFAMHGGDCMATIFKRFGAIGMVSDSALRDIDEIRPMNFHLYATGMVASHANFRLVRLQVPVTICGMTVNPGDLLHGDRNGLITVPKEGRERLPELAAEVTRRESYVRDYAKGENVDLKELTRRMVH